MDTEAVDNEADIMDVQSLRSYSDSSEGSGVNILTPAASQAGDNETSDVTPAVKPFEEEVVHLDVDQISDWLDDTESAHSAKPEQAADMTLISHDENNSLEGSAYDLIDDDIESSHGAETESISDCSVSRPSDVVSLADDEKSMDDTESEASISHSAIPAYAGLDDNEDTPRVGLSTANVHSETSAFDSHDAQLQHIAFKEPEVDGVETASQVSVMHTVKEFSMQEVDAIGLQIGSGIHQRLVGTIRQTMTKEYLSLTEPLRIMYIGSHQARQDILQKFGSSVAASRDDNGHSIQSTQLYNVVSISAFGSGKTPEVELTQSSAVQFKICDLEKAVRDQVSANPNDPNTLTLTLDHNSKVHSLPLTKKFEIQPKNWEKPHIAVFYCSDTDTEVMRNTLEVSNSFMQRHNIPRIVISHKPLFDTASKVNLRLGHQPIHMCLESRDPAKPNNSILFRLPIDLTSFLNIDARQMNRNLACITGLYEAPPVAPKSEEKEKKISELPLPEAIIIAANAYTDWIDNRFIQVQDALAAFNDYVDSLSLPLVVLATFLACALGFAYGYGAFSPLPANHGIIHNNGTCVAPIMSSISSPPSSATSTSYSTTTRTTTITVTHAPTSTTVTAPKATDKAPTGGDAAMDLISSFISVDLQGEREVVLRSTKANIGQMKKDANLAFWLWREVRKTSEPCSLAMANKTLVWEKASWAESGVSILLKKEDVHGTLRIGVESTTAEGRKIRKTYNLKLSEGEESAVTLNQIGKCLQDEVIPLLVDDISRTFSAWSVQAAKQAHLLAHKSQDVLREVKTKLYEAKPKERMARKMDKMKRVQAQIARQAEKTEQVANDVHKAMNEKFLRAQVKSRLIWLRRKGMFKEAREYEVKANKAGVFGKVEEKAEARSQKTEGQAQNKACPRGIARKARKCRAAGRL